MDLSSLWANAQATAKTQATATMRSPSLRFRPKIAFCLFVPAPDVFAAAFSQIPINVGPLMLWDRVEPQ